jgi:thiol-disulfide isomerase/thioredoxin
MDTIRNLTTTQKVLFVLLTLLLVYCAFLIFAYLQKNNLDKKKVHFKETFEVSQDKPNKTPKNNKSKIILMWAEWCGHCVNFKPEFDKCRQEVAASSLKDHVEVLDFNEKDYPKKLAEYGGQGFPTVVFEDSEGKFDSYEGPRTSEALISFINTKLGK